MKRLNNQILIILDLKLKIKNGTGKVVTKYTKKKNGDYSVHAENVNKKEYDKKLFSI